MFSHRQLHLHQGPRYIVVSNPAPFPLHINQISTLPLPHILVEAISQVTVPSRTLMIVSTTFTSMPKPNYYYSQTGTPSVSKQNPFVVPLLNIFGIILPVYLLCTIIIASPDYVYFVKNDILVKCPPLSYADNSVHPHSLMR